MLSLLINNNHNQSTIPNSGGYEIEEGTIVVDIGKTNAKVSLWDARGTLIARQVRGNEQPRSVAGYRTLDVDGIDAWLIDAMREFASHGDVARIIPIGHGAAAVLLAGGERCFEPLDYEENIDADERVAYDSQRDAFSVTGSPVLPQGLNLGAQLHHIECIDGPLADNVTILPWAQYWAWRLCGIAASEVTSLGCHSDLWRPTEKSFSELAVQRGWADRMAPLRNAGDSLRAITPEVAAATGLNRDCVVMCGLHDSNAALLAARGHAEIAANEATVLSTGTWFVAMRSVGAGVEVDISALEETRDCLVNVDVCGRPTPSARFMGGREAELASGVDSFRLTDKCEPEELLARLPALINKGVIAVPGFVAGVGPFPDAAGRWQNKPKDALDLRAATDLYLALIADTSLDLIGSRDRLLVEGRFAEDAAFVRILATLRPTQKVYTSNAVHDVAYGALRLVNPDLAPASGLTAIEPLDLELGDYAAGWRAAARRAQETA